MDDPREFPYVVESSPKYVGAKVIVRQLRTRQDAVNEINSVLKAGMEALNVYKIQQVSVQDFMNEADQKNWCHDCQEFVVNSDQAKRCEDLNHFMMWNDPRNEDTTLNKSGV